MESNDAQDPREARANELYWESTESVNQIADELDVSKGSLYGMIHPLAAGLPCPRCHAEMEYPNRTARDKGLLACPACGLEERDEDVRDLWGDVAALREGEGGDAAPVVRAPPGSAPDMVGRRPLPYDRTLVGAAFLSAAAGFVLGRLSKRS